LTYTHTFEKPQREFSLMTLYSLNTEQQFCQQPSESRRLFHGKLLKNVNKSFNQERPFRLIIKPRSHNSISGAGGKNMHGKFPVIINISRQDRTASIPPLRIQRWPIIFSYDQNVTAVTWPTPYPCLRYALKPGRGTNTRPSTHIFWMNRISAFPIRVLVRV